MNTEAKNLFTCGGDLLSYQSIIRIEEISNETFFFLQDGSRSKSVLTIDALEWELPKEVFVRVHPNHLINLNFSRKLFTVHTQWIELENGEKIPISNELGLPKPIRKDYLIMRWLKSFLHK